KGSRHGQAEELVQQSGEHTSPQGTQEFGAEPTPAYRAYGDGREEAQDPSCTARTCRESAEGQCTCLPSVPQPGTLPPSRSQVRTLWKQALPNHHDLADY